MDKNITAANFAQKDEVSGVVKKVGVITRNIAFDSEENPQYQMIDNQGSNAETSKNRPGPSAHNRHTQSGPAV